MLALLVSLWAHPAVAQDEADDDAPDEIIEVQGTSDELFGALSDKLRRLGFLRPVRRGKHVVFAPRTPWKPALHVYGDGRVDVTRGPIQLRLFGQGRSAPGKQSFCVGPSLSSPGPDTSGLGPALPPVMLPAACASLDGLTVNTRILRSEQARLVQAVAPELSAWSKAIARESYRQRVDVDMPTELEAMLDDAPTEQEGYDAVLAWGCSRTDTDAGDEARGVAATVLGARFPDLHPDGDVDWPGLCGWGPDGPPW
jgi:hypothetical protein